MTPSPEPIAPCIAQTMTALIDRENDSAVITITLQGEEPVCVQLSLEALGRFLVQASGDLVMSPGI